MSGYLTANWLEVRTEPGNRLERVVLFYALQFEAFDVLIVAPMVAAL